MSLTPAQTAYLHDLARELSAAPASGGARTALVARAAETLGKSPKTVYALLKRHTGWESGRKTRADKGETCVDRELARLAGGLSHLSDRPERQADYHNQGRLRTSGRQRLRRRQHGNRRSDHAKL